MKKILAMLAALLALAPAGARADNWVEDPYLSPVMGVSTYSGQGSVAVVLGTGVGGGFRYVQRRGPLEGKSRAQAIYYMTSGGSGYDLRLGSFIGPNRRFWAAETGLDLFYNVLTTPVFSYEASRGVDWPVDLTLGPRNIYALFGTTTTWMENPSRRVDWESSGEAGYGHEFETRVGGGVGVRGVSIRLVYHHRIQSWGVTQGVSIGLDYRKKPR